MCNVNPLLRYSASLALSHPWITRDFGNLIPLTMYEESSRRRILSELIDVARSVFFVAECNRKVLCKSRLEENKECSQA